MGHTRKIMGRITTKHNATLRGISQHNVWMSSQIQKCSVTLGKPQSFAACCSMLQCVCSVLQRFAVLPPTQSIDLRHTNNNIARENSREKLHVTHG